MECCEFRLVVWIIGCAGGRHPPPQVDDEDEDGLGDLGEYSPEDLLQLASLLEQLKALTAERDRLVSLSEEMEAVAAVAGPPAPQPAAPPPQPRPTVNNIVNNGKAAPVEPTAAKGRAVPPPAIPSAPPAQPQGPEEGEDEELTADELAEQQALYKQVCVCSCVRGCTGRASLRHCGDYDGVPF